MALAQLTKVRPQDETKALSWLTVSEAPAGEFAWPADQGRPPREPAGGGSFGSTALSGFCVNCGAR
jgi:hypothetical protein